MKKLWFGLTLVISGSLFIMGALIGGGLVANGTSYRDILDSEVASTFIFIGIIIFIIGFIVSLKEMIHEEK